jgi:hypothetical protein
MEEGLSDEIYQICHDYLTFTRNELNGANVRGSRVRMKGDKKAEVII